jgi:hypothetical protein
MWRTKRRFSWILDGLEEERALCDEEKLRKDKVIN